MIEVVYLVSRARPSGPINQALNILIENEKNGLLVPKNDVDALAAAMKRMLSDREFSKACGNEAYKISERLSPEKIYSEWENYIMSVINR